MSEKLSPWSLTDMDKDSTNRHANKEGEHLWDPNSRQRIPGNYGMLLSGERVFPKEESPIGDLKPNGQTWNHIHINNIIWNV